MKLTEKAAYIKGLADGLGIDESSKEGKLIAALIELTSEMANVIAEQDDQIETLQAYVEELDEDLGDVEEMLYDEADDGDDGCDGFCEGCTEDCEFAEDEEYFEVECPSCGEVICFDGTLDPEELACPACGEKFECIVSEEDLKALDGEDA